MFSREKCRFHKLGSYPKFTNNFEQYSSNGTEFYSAVQMGILVCADGRGHLVLPK